MAHTTQQDDAQERSNVESFGMQRGSDNPIGPQHSGEGRLGQNILVFIIAMAIFVFGIFTLGFYPDGGWMVWTGSVVLMLVSWFAGFHLLSSKTNTHTAQNSTDLNLL